MREAAEIFLSEPMTKEEELRLTSCLFFATLLALGVWIGFAVALGQGQGLDLPVVPGDPLQRKPEFHAPAWVERPAELEPSDLPPPVFFGEEIESENDTIVYVLDRSSSMSIEDRYVDPETGYARTAYGSRWDRARAECLRSVGSLATALRFDIVIFDCGTLTLWSAPREATGENKTAARSWLEAQAFAGGTGTGPAVAMGLQLGETQAVALLTDGAPTCPWASYDEHRAAIRRANRQGATISVFGIGQLGPDERAFCMGVAADSGGTFTDVD